MADAAEVLRMVGDRISSAIDGMLRDDLPKAFGEIATPLYKEQFAQKANPYGEPWEPRPGDENNKRSTWRFGKVTTIEPYGFGLFVAKPNARRSCVPFEPRGLGSWKGPFDEAMHRALPSALAGLK